MTWRADQDVNLTISAFPVQDEWLLEAILLTPGTLFGLLLNILIIKLGRDSSILGNFRFAINLVALVNALYCLGTSITLLFYFTYHFLHLETSLTGCTLIRDLSTYVSYFIVIFIPVIGAYRCVLLCIRNGQNYLTKEKIFLTLLLLTVLPSVIVVGRIIEMINETEIGVDNICGNRYSDSGCIWCNYFAASMAIVSYSFSSLLAVCLMIHIFRSFRRIGQNPIIGTMSPRTVIDEAEMLFCIIVHTVVPILLTIPTDGRMLFHKTGLQDIGSEFAASLFDYYPLFDAVMIIVCVKPYRRTVLKSLRLSGEERTSQHRIAMTCANQMGLAGLAVIQPNRQMPINVLPIASVQA